MEFSNVTLANLEHDTAAIYCEKSHNDDTTFLTSTSIEKTSVKDVKTINDTDIADVQVPNLSFEIQRS